MQQHASKFYAITHTFNPLKVVVLRMKLMSMERYASTNSVFTHTLDNCGGVKRVFFKEKSHISYKINGNGTQSIMMHILSLHAPLTPGVESKVKTFFSEMSHVAYQINGNVA